MIFVSTLAIVGLCLIFLEFFLPGIVMAVSGGILLMASLFFFHMERPGSPMLLVYLGVLCFAVYGVCQLALFFVRKTSKKGTVYLSSDQMGFQASSFPKELIGSIAIAETDLKPSGHISIEGKQYQAISKTGYIDKQTLVEVLGGEGNCFFVKPADLKHLR